MVPANRTSHTGGLRADLDLYRPRLHDTEARRRKADRLPRSTHAHGARRMRSAAGVPQCVQPSRQSARPRALPPLPVVIRCPYHSWTYELDGTLKGTPHIGGFGTHENDGFDRRAHGLKPIRAAQWLDLVFVNLSGDAPSFEQHIATLEDRIYALADPSQYERMRPAATHDSVRRQRPLDRMV